MEQTHNQRSLQLYFLYLMFGGYLVAEPTFLKLFFQAYLPDFYYRFLTVPLSIVFGLAAIQQWRLYCGYTPISFLAIFWQSKSISLAQKSIVSISAIKRTCIDICQAGKYLTVKFFPLTKFRYQFWSEVLDSILNLRHQTTNRNSYSQKIATEPTAIFWRNRKYIYCLLAELSQLLLVICIPWLFWQNIRLWGWFDTTLTFAWEALLIFIFIYLCNICIMNSIKRQQLAEQSGEDLLELSNTFQSLETEGWQFKYRVILPEIKNGFQWKKCNFESLISRLSSLLKKQRDIDVWATSPEGNNFVIDLKSHVGEVVWNSKENTIYHRLVIDSISKPVPFRGGDLLDKIHGQAKRLKEKKNLSQSPERILVFWQAWVRISENDRIKRGVLISSKKRLVRDLKKRNRQLLKKMSKHSKN